MNDKILDWINEVMASRKESILEYILSKELDDTFGWGKLLCSYLNVSEEMMRTKRGLLLTGPRGCGKHTAAYHVVKYLCSKNQWAVKHNADPFGVEFLSGDDLRFPDSEWYMPYEFVKSIFDSYGQEKLFLVVDLSIDKIKLKK